MGGNESTINGETSPNCGWHGNHYTPNNGGAYEIGYSQGYEDGALGHSSEDVENYVISSMTESGNQGYADGYKDAEEGLNSNPK